MNIQEAAKPKKCTPKKCKSPKSSSSSHAHNDDHLCSDIISASLQEQTASSKASCPGSCCSSFDEKLTVSSDQSLNLISYSEILIHNINVSLQEHQKKISIYKKKFARKQEPAVFGVKQAQDTTKKLEEETGVLQPEIQYMNNYSESASRMKCFTDITGGDFLLDEELDGDMNEESYNHCDANQYEYFLDQLTGEQDERLESNEQSKVPFNPSSIPQMSIDPAQ